MKLYRIRRKSDGKCFNGWYAPWSSRYVGKSKWSEAGTFYRTIDGIAFHLKTLSCDWKFHPSLCGRFKERTRVIVKEHPSRLEEYEVIVNDVKIRGEEIIEAAELMKKRKKK